MANNSKKKQRLIFYICAMAWPIIQFIIFYVCVNINSILLAFRQYDALEGYSFVGFANFKRVFSDFVELAYIGTAFKNTFIVFGLSILTMFFPIVWAYYLYKKYLGHNLFKIMLFIPSIIPGITLVLCYKYFAEIAVPEVWKQLFDKKILGLLSNSDTKMKTILFYGIFIGIGSTFLLYLGAMTGISESIIEAAALDGITPIKEFVYIIFPLVYPTFSTFMVTSFAVIFANQINLFSFYGPHSEYSTYTIGYFLYVRVQTGTLTDYPYLATFGLILTLIIVPLCYLLKWGLAKFGPKTE